ncbi:phosphatase PAP2 family protein [uncultured Sphingomonas sp.]|uniref:phosphatase PAP2 family protein n=1 Tax=uncultured Sphingomonas sp. TaxID=158754 RepID=UPI0035C9A439
MPEAAPIAAVKEAADAVERVDIAVTEAMDDYRDRPIVKALGFVSEIGDQPPLRALTLGASAVGAWMGNPRLTRAGIRMFAAHSLATGLKNLIKRSIDRTRPDHALDNHYRMEVGDSYKHELSSFPSGHTAGALAVTQALARDYPGSRIAGLAVTTAVAAIQVPRCKHFVSDIVAGAAIGWAAEQVSSRLFDWAEEKLATTGN